MDKAINRLHVLLIYIFLHSSTLDLNAKMSLKYLPSVTPSAIALGTVFTHASSLVLSSPVFGEAFATAKKSDTPEEFLKSKEATSALGLWSSSLVGSAAKTYAVAALLQTTGVLTNKGAAYLGGLLFTVTTLPGIAINIVQEKRPWDYVAAKAVSELVGTVGLALTLNWWGTRPSLTK
ncbi:uncharacterized protein V1510DRAFT_287362 [Dipodascopsis tothii]|uniref:uncharacterized protein n=1 Tax=Dipodascopsis tothii TaxID=44089 RepID=UPI0034CD81F1